MTGSDAQDRSSVSNSAESARGGSLERDEADQLQRVARPGGDGERSVSSARERLQLFSRLPASSARRCDDRRRALDRRESRRPASMAIASAILFAGSNGVKRAAVDGARPAPLPVAAIVRMTESIGSWPSAELASAAKAENVGFVIARLHRADCAHDQFDYWSACRSCRSRAHRPSPPRAMRDSRVSKTPFSAIVFAPKAAANVNVAGRATGTADSSAVSTSRMICCPADSDGERIGDEPDGDRRN